MVFSDSIYRMASLGVAVGKHWSFHADGGTMDFKPLKEVWGLHSGVYTPRQLVEAFAPLLDAVVFRLGNDSPGAKPARVQLLDNLAANLATDTRETTLRLIEPLDTSRQEIKDQANRIGQTLVQWARDSGSKSFDPEMYLRSPCEGHLLIPANVNLMFGDRAAPHLMQLFNEYMHQMVLLRDALLPFQNFQDVLIPVSREARGIRYLETARSQFLSELLTKQTTQKGVISYAKALLAPGLLRTADPGYGFQYMHGTVLPAFLSGERTPLHLLQYIPAKLKPSTTEIVFDYRFVDYYTAPRLQIPDGIQTAAIELGNFPQKANLQVKQSKVDILPNSKADGPQQLQVELVFSNGKRVTVDLGQIARGYRYSYLANDSSPAKEETSAKGISNPTHLYVVHDPASILETPDTGLVTAKEGGIHIIPTQDPLVVLAVLGKLYPENVVLLPDDEGLDHAANTGKGFGPKFIIWGGIKRGGLKGFFK
ncbi:hypothetical protein N7462_009642 [Penicillium macrosclerotiorum]|uniref:uncharacterized protein n=1 Tax=Penicillium macrosclerotiorum TaxID=303699 RepID=UPI0025467642|nr:uncharacterized protein N7462_009642 [Penicillium macrosclerotiorum]KAJ5674203.1 hypothetical protein N7462_009642 [Penicillium macrosclerotiorum]